MTLLFMCISAQCLCKLPDLDPVSDSPVTSDGLLPTATWRNLIEASQLKSKAK